MLIKANSVDEYIAKCPLDRQEILQTLRQIILKNLPKGFVEEISYNMIGYVVPHSIYPAGYHCDPKLPLPFLAIASQKNFIAFYHMGIYARPELLQKFEEDYKQKYNKKLDSGKSCFRFKKPSEIPVDLIGNLVQKMTVKEWIKIYENSRKN